MNRIIDLVKQSKEKLNEQKEALSWNGTVEEYIELITANPEVVATAHKRIDNMLQEAGIDWVDKEDGNGKRPHYKFFEKELYGIEKCIDKVGEYFNSAGQRLPVRKRLLMLMGPPGSGKSTMVSLLKKGLEEYTKTNNGAIYRIKGCPMNDDPLTLMPEDLRKVLKEEYNIHVEGTPCPACTHRLENDYNGDWTGFEVERFTFSEQLRRGIGTFMPSDPKTQDVAELVGSINLSKIADFGDEADPRAYDFNGELNVSNRGLVEMIEMLKCVSEDTMVNTNSSGFKSMGTFVQQYIPDDFDYIPGNNVKVNELIKDGTVKHLVYAGKQPIAKVRTSRGYNLECAYDHKIQAVVNGNIEWAKISDLDDGDYVVINRKSSHSKTLKDLPQIVISNNMKNIITSAVDSSKFHVLGEHLATILGYFSSEGSFGGMSVNLSVFEEDAVNSLKIATESLGLRMKRYPIKSTDRQEIKIHSKYLRDLIKELGGSGNAFTKRVPSLLFESPDFVKAAYLRAIFDGDGTVGARISYSSRSQDLINDLQQLLLSFGIVCNVLSNDVNGIPNHYLHITGKDIRLYQSQIGFNLDRKNMALKELCDSSLQYHRDIVPIGLEFIDGISIPTSDKRYATVRSWKAGRSMPSYNKLEEFYDILPMEMKIIVDNNLLFDKISSIEFMGEKELWDLNIEEDHHSYITNGFISHNCDEKFLYVLLTLTQEQNIKTPRFPLLFADEIVIAHTNETEWNKFMCKSENEALRDRIITIITPYNLVLDNEVKINQKLLQDSSQKDIHISPHTLEVASMVAIMSRLNEPKSSSVDLLKKMKAYNGEEVEGLRKQEIAEMRGDEEREGMEGLSPRYISNSLSKAITRSKEILKKRIADNDVDDLYAIRAEELVALKIPLDPLMVLNGLMVDIKEDPKIPKDQSQKYETIIELTKQEYNRLITIDVHKAFVYGFEEEAQDMFQNYIDHAIAYCQKEKIVDSITGKNIDPDEKLMRAIERHINVAEAGKNEFRTEILNRMAAFSHRNKRFTYETHKALKEAIEKEIFERRKDTIHITTNTINPDPEQLEELNRVIKRMVQDLGYDPISANRALKYVARINQG